MIFIFRSFFRQSYKSLEILVWNYITYLFVKTRWNRNEQECRMPGNPCTYQVLCQGPDLLNLQRVYSFLEYIVSKKAELNFWTGHWGYDQPFSNLRTAWAHAYVTSRDNELSASGTDLTNELLIWLDIGRKIPTVTTVQCKKSLEDRVLHWQSFCMTSYLLNDLS